MKKKLIYRILSLTLVVIIGSLSFNATIVFKVNAATNVELSDLVITQISAGTNHNLALDQYGNLWAWGRNNCYQLGDGTKIDSLVPKQIFKGHKFSKISAGDGISAAIDIDGFLYQWGRDTATLRKVPTLMNHIERYDYVLCNPYEILTSSEGKKFFGYGYNGKSSPYPLPLITGKKTFNAFGKYEITNNIVAIDGVYYYDRFSSSYPGEAGIECYCYTFVIDSDGKLLTYKKTIHEYSSDRYIHRFFPDDMSFTSLEDIKLIDVSVSKDMKPSLTCSNTVFLVSDAGKIYALGDNTHGELGNSDFILSSYVSTPVEVNSSATFSTVSAGQNHVLALDNNGKVYSWGSNEYGQLGLGDTMQRTEPEKIHTFDKEKNFDFVAYSGDVSTGSFYQYGGLSYNVEKQGEKGILSINDNGDFTYETNEGVYGDDTAIISIEFDGISIQYDVYIKIDRKPVFIGGSPSFNVECGKIYNGNAPAIDPDNDPLIYSIYQEPTKGTVTLDNNAGSYTYTASSNMTGSDTFIIAVSDGYCTIQYPVSVNIKSLITSSDKTTINIDLTTTNSFSGNVNAVDIDGDLLSYSVIKNGTIGSVTIDSLGNYTYTANDNSYGHDTFILKIDDGYKPLEITYDVNIFSVYDAGSVLETKITQGTVYNGQIKTTAYNATPEYSIHTQPLNGIVSINEETGDYIYTPNLGSSGEDSFVVLVDYGFDQYTLTIHVYQNTIPNNSMVETEIVTLEGANYTGTAQCSDIDNDLLTYSIKTKPLKGSLSLNPTTGDYIYYPNDNVAGNDSFEINISDGTDVITVLINVHIESEILVCLEENKTISQNTSLSAKIDASDKDGDPITYTITNNAKHGVANVDTLTGDYSYIPNTNYFGLDTFVITVDDGVLPKDVTINVNVNRRPIAENIVINLSTEGVTVTNTATCSDPDGDVLTFSLASQPSQGKVIVNSFNGAFAYTPNNDAHGNDSFQIRATDGCDDIIVTINVHNETPVELEPQDSTIVVNQGKSTTGKVLAIDLDGDVLSYSMLLYPSQGTVNLNESTGAWTYNAKNNAEGSDSFEVQITDGNSTVTLKYTLIINTPASFEQDSYSFNTNQGENYTGSVVATDADGDSLIYSVVFQADKGFVTIDPFTGRYQYIPEIGEAGNDSFIIGVSDGNFITEVEVNVHIESDISVISGILTISVDQNDIVTGNVNASDLDGDNLTYSISKQGDKGNANVMGDGSFSYYANSQAGDDSFVILITDGIHTVYVTVYVHISSEPYFEESTISISVPQSGSTNGEVHGVDPDGDTLTYSIYQQPNNGTVNLNSTNGEYTYTTFTNTTASSDSFIIAVSDGNTNSYVVVNVVINNAPSVEDSTISVNQGGSVTGVIKATDSENDTLTYTISSQGSHGTVSINSSTGEYSYITNDRTYSGKDYFTISVTDGYSTKTVVISVEVVKNNKPTGTGTNVTVDSNSTVEGQLNIADPENDNLIYSISYQGDKGIAFIDENTGEFTYSAKPDTSGNDCFVVNVSDGYNNVSYLVEVQINFVDSNKSWAIPTTIATGTVAILSLGGLIFVVLKKKIFK